jgi:hypothetical protein
MYIGSASLGFSPFDRYARPPVPINDTLCLMYIRLPGVPARGWGNWHETETLYIKHSVSLIGTGGQVWLSKGENPNETETMFCFARVLSL